MTDIPFEDVGQALRFAHYIEASDIVHTSAIFRDLRGGTVKLTGPISAWEKVIQAAFIIRYIDKVLYQFEADAIRALYIRPIGALAERKEFLCRMTSEEVWQQFNRKTDRWFVADVIRKWANLRPDHDVKWWAEKMEKREWRVWQTKKKLLALADAIHETALRKLADQMYEDKMVRFVD